MPVDYDFIRNILENFEGKGICRGYVPKDKKGNALGNSGVTIGTGVDLGQQSGTRLLAMGVPERVLHKLRPYLGLRGQEAITRLESAPLLLSDGEIETLDEAVIGSYIREVATRYGIQFGRKGAFASLPRQVQAVLVSLRYHLGFAGFPKTWDMLLKRDYSGAISELENPQRWGNKYMSRRKSEAGLLREVL